MDQTGAGAARPPASAGAGGHSTSTGCVVCGLDQDANQILLCDGCDAEYHIYCLVPPLKEIPEGDFYCRSCKDAKRHLTGKPAAAAATALSDNGPTQAGLAIQDEHGRMVPVRSEDVRASKYKGVLKLLHKGAKKPFVARIEKDRKFNQLGLFSSEIEAAHAYDKAAIQLFGRDAQLNFPHLHDGFVRATTSATATIDAKAATTTTTKVAASTAHAAAAIASPGFGTPGRGRGRGRGRGSGGRGSRGGASAGGGGRGKRRLEDGSPVRDPSSTDVTPHSAVKKRKPIIPAVVGAGDPTTDTPITTGPRYLGVQAFRGYAHAQITVNGKIVNLGTFPTAVDAATAYDKAALKYFGGDMGSTDAQHDRIVLNFPNKRADLLKQLIEESMHQKARQASGTSAHAGGAGGSAATTAATSANRSMQSAKHNLSIKKLENWVMKLQRSVKLVEAAHRVKWDGLPLVKPEEPPTAADGEENGEEATSPQEIKLELLAGAGPTIKTDFTKKQQRLRSGASDIESAVELMIQELKIYADDTPVDVGFIPPPRSHALLDLMSTSRFLKLCSTINELAHFSVTGSDGDRRLVQEDATPGEDSFEALVQTVVDYRARLQMAAASEKQKLAGLVDSETSEPTSPKANAPSSSAVGTESNSDAIARELLQNAKYVRRKVQRIRTVPKVVHVIEAAAVVDVADEEQKEEESVIVAVVETKEAAKENEKEEERASAQPEGMEVEQAEAKTTTTSSEEIDKLADANSDTTSKAGGIVVNDSAVDVAKEAPSADKTNEDVAMVDEEASEPVAEVAEPEVDATVSENPVVVDAKVPKEPEEKAESVNEVSKEAEGSKEEDSEEAEGSKEEVAEEAEGSKEEMIKEAEGSKEEVTKEAEGSKEEVTEGAEGSKEEVTEELEASKEETTDMTADPSVKSPEDTTASPDAAAKKASAETTEAAPEAEATADAVLPTSDGDVEMGDAVPKDETEDPITTDAQPVETAIVAEEPVQEVAEKTFVEDAWEYCLALKPQPSSSRTAAEKDGLWRLVPLESERGEFVEDIFLTDDEVSEIEVTEAEVCGVARRDESKLSSALVPTPPLVDLHKHEVVLRERVKTEADRRAALEGVIKIEQERLSQVFVVYRRMLEGITAKAGVAQKKHQRITRDQLLVDLMKQTFAPILEELLEQCDSVFLQRLEKLSDRFEDFQQEFDYYTDALVSVSGRKPDGMTQENGHMKGEEEPVTEGNGDVATDMEVDDDDEESSGLRSAYVSFYMEEIEALWKERCRAVESLHAILRSLPAPVTAPRSPAALTEGEDAAVAVVPELDPTLSSATLLRRRVGENLEQWKSVVWPAQLATPPFMTSFLSDSSSRGSGAIAPRVPAANQPERTPINTALGELKQIIIDLTQESPSSMTTRAVRHSTLVVYHPVFLEHQTPRDHPECPERLNRIITMLNTLRKKYDDSLKIDRLTQSPDELSPSESVLLAVHSPAYLQQLKDRSKEASTATEPTLRGVVALASSALVFETNRGNSDLPVAGLSGARASPTGSMGGAFGASSMPTGIAMDTYVSSKSWDVARAAAGTVCLAVDRVVRKEFRNAACLVRPPGHHVGRHGRTLDAPSSGFCLLNNVVIGAVHARQYPWIRRVAVLDWDIHHGNGTEELMRDDPDALFASIHLYASGKYFPGTGKGEQSSNLVNVALENSGAGSGSAAFRSALQEQILPAMRAFRPDIIFISAGFDGHKDDILGGRAAVKNLAVPAGYVEEDYVWATQEVLKLADECCDGRVVSVLEGGYDVRKETNSLAKSVGAHVGAIAAYEQERERLHKQSDGATSTEIASEDEKVKSEGTSTGVLLSLLTKDMNDHDVVIIDDDDDDEDETSAVDKSTVLSAGGDVDVDDEDDGVDEEDVDGDGVEVEEEDVHHDDEGDDIDEEDVVMTDEDHDSHSVDDEPDAHSAGLSFAASLSVNGDDDQHSQEGVDDGDVVMDDLARSDGRIATPDYDNLDGTGEEEGDDDMGGGDSDGDDDGDHGDGDSGDLLGGEDQDSAGELPSLS